MSPLWLKAIPYLATAGLLFGVYSYVHHDGYVEGKNDTQQKWDKETGDRKEAEAKQAQKDLQKALDNQRLINEAEVRKNEDRAKIDKLLADNRALRVRLPKPATMPQADLPAAPSDGAHQAKAGRDILGEAERILGDDRRRTKEIIGECAVDANLARPVIEWSQAQGSKGD